MRTLVPIHSSLNQKKTMETLSFKGEEHSEILFSHPPGAPSNIGTETVLWGSTWTIETEDRKEPWPLTLCPHQSIYLHVTNLTSLQDKEHPLCDAERQFREQDPLSQE